MRRAISRFHVPFGRPAITLLVVCVLSVLLCGPVFCAEVIRPTNAIPLFNGRDLAGFYTWLVDTKREDPRRVFTVTNGTIRISGDGLGYLATEREYRDYRLLAEFRWGERNWRWGDRIGKARDSGIFLHAIGPDGNSHDGNGAFMAAVECNVFQGAVGDFLLIRGSAADGSLLAPRITAEVAEKRDADGWFTWQRAGERQTIERWGRLNWFGKAADWQDVIDFRGPRDIEKPRGEWNRIECICRGGRITVRLNGVTINDASDVFPSAGKILFQCEGSEVFFRKLELRPLDEPTAKAEGRRVQLSDAQMFVPAGFEIEDGAVNLLVHFHGAPEVMEREFVASGFHGALVVANAPGLSAKYAERFREPATFERLLDEAVVELRKLGVREPRIGQLTVSSFSAGFGAVRELLRHDRLFQQLDALVMADSIYAGFSEPSARHVEPAHMEGFVRFARAAARGEKHFVLSHSQLHTPTYASTVETAEVIIAALAGARETRTEEWAPGLVLASRFQTGAFEVFGFRGDTGEDHMAHLRNIRVLLKRLRAGG